jgi:hypothetical protein
MVGARLRGITAKEKVLELAPRWSEHDAEIALRAVEREHEAGDIVDEWGNISELTGAAATQVMRDLAEEERAQFGETIAEAWQYESPR